MATMAPVQRATIRHDNSAIFGDVVRMNDIHYKDICYITDTPESTVFKWLNGTLKPTNFALLTLYDALFLARLIIPKRLEKFVRAHKSRAKYWASLNRSEREKANVIIDGKTPKKYRFNGVLMTLSEIESQPMCVVSNKTLRSRIKTNAVAEGSEVAGLAAIYPQQGKKIAKQKHY